jgi:predicted RNA binding protein YcfA (HicA-like mRNA interferase family)
MPELPVLSGEEAVKAFERAGWRVDRQRGSHVIMLKAGQIASLSIPPTSGISSRHTSIFNPRIRHDS